MGRDRNALTPENLVCPVSSKPVVKLNPAALVLFLWPGDDFGLGPGLGGGKFENYNHKSSSLCTSYYYDGEITTDNKINQIAGIIAQKVFFIQIYKYYIQSRLNYLSKSKYKQTFKKLIV